MSTIDTNTNTESGLWPDCGHQLLHAAADGSGRLCLSDDYLQQLWRRPEVAPVAESCPSEQALHQALLADPRRPVSDAEIEALADPDGRDNYRLLLGFRARLLSHDTIEKAYLSCVNGSADPPPPALVDLLVQAIAVQVLRQRSANPFAARAAELFFRRQKVGLEQGVLLVDAERLAQRQPASLQVLQSLIAQADIVSTPTDRRETFAVLNTDTAASYWQQACRWHPPGSDLVLALNSDGPGLSALCGLLADWVGHFYGVKVSITPRSEINDPRWRWHIGLDAVSNRLLNALYQGQTLSDAEQRQLLLLLQLDFADPGRVRAELVDKPVYLGLAMDDADEVKLKPQNLLLNLPLAAPD